MVVYANVKLTTKRLDNYVRKTNGDRSALTDELNLREDNFGAIRIFLFSDCDRVARD